MSESELFRRHRPLAISVAKLAIWSKNPLWHSDLFYLTDNQFMSKLL